MAEYNYLCDKFTLNDIEIWNVFSIIFLRQSNDAFIMNMINALVIIWASKRCFLIDHSSKY